MQRPTVRRGLPLLPLLALALWGCGTRVHEHEVELALYLPRLERLGFFVVRLEPKARPAGEAAASFAPWGDSFPAGKAPALGVTYEAAPARKGWRLALRLEALPRE